LAAWVSPENRRGAPDRAGLGGVPLGDLLERRRLVTAMCCLNAAALALCGASPNAAVFFVSSALFVAR
jgi:hypothetical protein